MDVAAAQESHGGTGMRKRRAPPWRRVWPAALGIIVAAGTAYELDDGREAAPVVAASGLVYLAASASGRRWAAWVAFGVAFVLIALDKFGGTDATPWMLGLAAVLLVAGLIGQRAGHWWSLPLQTIAMLVLGAIALLATHLSATIGGLVVAAALLGHAAWDIYHHRAGRVVGHSLAEFCAVLDVLVAVLVAVIALTA